MKRLLALAVLVFLVGCSAPTPAPSIGSGEFATVTVPAPALEGNLLGDPAEREVIIYLPPSYHTSDQRYPVVYYLAGYGERIGTFRTHREVVWDQMLAEGMKEFIIVELDGINSLGGNFYANSPVGGDAEDFLTQDLVAYVDENYRTIAQPSARGLSGFSMGGSGTVNVGLANPDVFGALFPIAPGLFVSEVGLDGFLYDNGNWRPYGATFAPDVTAAFPHFRPIDPDRPAAEQDPDLVAAWEGGYGDLRRKIEDYLAQPARFAEIRVLWGTADSYRWIPEGSQYFVDLLDEYGIPNSHRTVAGGHSVDYSYFSSDCVEFFSRTLG